MLYFASLGLSYFITSRLYVLITFTHFAHPYTITRGFLSSSAGKESACNAGDAGSIPGLGRTPGEGIGYPLQYSWASLVAQMVKNLPAMWETWVGKIPWRRTWQPTPVSCLESLHGQRSLAGYSQ